MFYFPKRTLLNDSESKVNLLSQSFLEPLISLDLDVTKLYCFKARVHCCYCFYIIFSANPVRRSEELLGGQVNFMQETQAGVQTFVLTSAR